MVNLSIKTSSNDFYDLETTDIEDNLCFPQFLEKHLPMWLVSEVKQGQALPPNICTYIQA